VTEKKAHCYGNVRKKFCVDTFVDSTVDVTGLIRRGLPNFPFIVPTRNWLKRENKNECLQTEVDGDRKKAHCYGNVRRKFCVDTFVDSTVDVTGLIRRGLPNFPFIVPTRNWLKRENKNECLQTELDGDRKKAHC
jgi:hypothetical protein